MTPVSRAVSRLSWRALDGIHSSPSFGCRAFAFFCKSDSFDSTNFTVSLLTFQLLVPLHHFLKATGLKCCMDQPSP